MQNYINTSAASLQLSLFDAADEASLYLQAEGYFALLMTTPSGGKRQGLYPTSQTVQVHRNLPWLTDIWTSQAVYWSRNRCAANVKCIDLSFLDIDYYKGVQEWATGKRPDQVALAFMSLCDILEVPRPSLIVHSGRGIQPKWLYAKPIPRPALKRWEAVQKELINKFLTFGADPSVKDCTRVLRTVRTVNSRSNTLCQVVGITPGDDGQPIRYDFENLCEYILPRPRPEGKKVYVPPRERKVVRAENNFNAQSLAWARLEDMRTLCAIRGGIAEGMRMNFLMYSLCFMVLSGEVNQSNFYNNASIVAKEIDPSWNYREAELETVYEKMLLALNGKTVEFAGCKVTPMYTPKSETLINLFQISDEEMQSLTSIVTASERRRRNAEAQTKVRRAAGAVPRAEYLGQAKARQERARALRAEGMSIRAIAAEMGLSKSQIQRYL